MDPFSAAKALGDEECGENACGDTAGLVGVELGVVVPAGLKGALMVAGSDPDMTSSEVGFSRGVASNWGKIAI